LSLPSPSPHVSLSPARLRPQAQGNTPDGLLEVRRALDFTLDRLGQDPASGELHRELLTLLLSVKPGTPECDRLFEGQERTGRIRVAFHRALLAPHQVRNKGEIYVCFAGFIDFFFGFHSTGLTV
jgi:hypothetical protein